MNSAHLYKYTDPIYCNRYFIYGCIKKKRYQYLFGPLYEIIALKDIGNGNDNAYDNKYMVLLL